MGIEIFSACDLHISHKDWADDPRERQNYLEIERWATHFRQNCLPKPSGGGTIHRIRYTVRNYQHSTPTGPEFRDDVIGDGSNHYVNWASPIFPPSDLISSGVFVPDNTADPSISLLHITVPGVLSWAGSIYYYLTAAGRVWYYIFDDSNSSNLEVQHSQASTSTTPDGPAISLGIGGSAYIPANTYLELVVRQYSGVVADVPVYVTFTLLEM